VLSAIVLSKVLNSGSASTSSLLRKDRNSFNSLSSSTGIPLPSLAASSSRSFFNASRSCSAAATRSRASVLSLSKDSFVFGLLYGGSVIASKSSVGFGLASSGLGALSPGFGVLSSGLGALSSGFGVLSSGFGVLSSGFGVLSSGFGVLSSGFGVLSSGLGALSSGFGAPVFSAVLAASILSSSRADSGSIEGWLSKPGIADSSRRSEEGAAGVGIIIGGFLRPKRTHCPSRDRIRSVIWVGDGNRPVLPRLGKRTGRK